MVVGSLCMPIEIFANVTNTRTPISIGGLTISDIAAIAAIISSAIIFYLGYNRKSKSEQIKISREVMDRINSKFRMFLETKPRHIRDADGKEIRITLNAITDVCSEIEFFDYYLLGMHEIKDRKIKDYCIPKIHF